MIDEDMTADEPGTEKEETIVEQAKKRYAQCEDAWAENREQALDDIKFARLNQQWPESIREQREREGRPCLTINRLPTFIRQVVNDARLNSPAIVVHPVDSDSDVDTAEVINGIIRNIEQNSNAEVSYDRSLEDAVTCGFGFFRIDIDYAYDDSFDLDIRIERIANPLSVLFDPTSTAADASDWQYCFIVDDMEKEQFQAAYPNADMASWDEGTEWMDDDNIRVAEYWTKEEVDIELLLLQNGITVHAEQYMADPVLQTLQIVKRRPSKTFKVKQYIISGGEEPLEENDWPGRTIPICPVFGDEVLAEGQRHFLSLIRHAKDSQQNYNYWRSAATEMVALQPKAPVIGPVGAFDTDIRKWETMNQDNHPFIEYDQVGPPPQFTPPRQVDPGSIQEAMNASDDLKQITGIYDASLGARSNETSGRAILARQKEGDVGTFHFIDNLSRAIRYAGRCILDLIPHVYNAPRTLRVLGYDGEADTVRVNDFENAVGKLYDLTKGKYDLVVKTGASFSSKREEAFTQMTEMVRVQPQLASLIGDLIAKNADWPGSEEIAKRMKAMLPPQIQALDKMEDLPPEAQAKVAGMQAEMKKMQEAIDTLKQMMKQKDQEIAGLQLDKKDKTQENQLKAQDLQVKIQDIEKKYAAQMAKVTADLEIAQAKIKEDQREMIVDSTLEAIKLRLDTLGESVAKSQLDRAGQDIMNIENNKDALAAAITALANRSSAKVMEIQAPSGEVYTGSVIEE